MITPDQLFDRRYSPGPNKFAGTDAFGRKDFLPLSAIGSVITVQEKEFTVAASTWVWTHNLGRKLAGIQAFDASNNLITTDIQENTDNQITATHLANITGWLRGS